MSGLMSDSQDDRLRDIEQRIERIEAYLAAEEDFEAPQPVANVPPSESGRWTIETRITMIGGASHWQPFAVVESADAAAALLAADVERRAVPVPVEGVN